MGERVAQRVGVDAARPGVFAAAEDQLQVAGVGQPALLAQPQPRLVGAGMLGWLAEVAASATLVRAPKGHARGRRPLPITWATSASKSMSSTRSPASSPRRMPLSMNRRGMSSITPADEVSAVGLLEERLELVDAEHCDEDL